MLNFLVSQIVALKDGGMSDELVEAAVSLLVKADVRLDTGLSQAEREAIEARFGFTFAPDHAALLTACLPAGDGWPGWRSEPLESLSRRVAAPIEGALFDVSVNSFWPASWGVKPDDDAEAADVARARLLLWPTMVPLYSHRYMAAGPAGHVVFSIHQTDVVYYGSNLLDYFRREFGAFGDQPFVDANPLWPWSQLAHGAEDSDL